ncbi:MAG TPA: zf-HC2 domain-containing protein [Candidatus Baltobacteraceae bacterium]|nr:zf-HC2 domain-containing protein [Candidatus Baltobacteraceae bacterium]
MTQHIGEDAELYALGALDPGEARAVDEHVRTCDACAARLGEAEAAVSAAIVPAEPSLSLDRRMRTALRAPLPWARIAPLLAASFVLGLLPFFAALPARHDTSQHDLAVAALVNSHFAHVPFAALSPDAPKAKLLYGRGVQSWRFIVAQTGRAYRVRGIVDGRETDFGTLQVNGASAELFVPQTRARVFELYDGSREVSRSEIPGR